MSNLTPNLGSVINNATVRKAIYGVYVIALVGVGALQVAFATIDGPTPQWLTISLAVLAYLGVPVGGLALANTSNAPANPTINITTVNPSEPATVADISELLRRNAGIAGEQE